jgi:hypothetical protein
VGYLQGFSASWFGRLNYPGYIAARGIAAADI